MLFIQFIVDRLEIIDKAARGFGDQISERSLYEALPPALQQAEQFAVLVKWGLSTGVLEDLSSSVGRRFRIHRRSLARWRLIANGEQASRYDEFSPKPRQ